MLIDFHRLIDGLSVVAEQIGDGRAGVGVIEGLLITISEATGAVGATYAEFAEDGTGRVVAASGALTFTAGQPVPPEVIDLAWNGMWAGPTFGLDPILVGVTTVSGILLLWLDLNPTWIVLAAGLAGGARVLFHV